MTTTSSSITTNSLTMSNSNSNDTFSAALPNLNCVLNSSYPVGIHPSPYAVNYSYPPNYFYSVPYWIPPLNTNNDHHKNDDQVVANQTLSNNMKNRIHSSILDTLCSNLNKFSPKNSKSDEVLLQDCIDGLTEYAANFNFQISREEKRSRKRRRTISSGFSSDSDYTDIDSECEDIAPNELLMLEKSLHKIKKEHEKTKSTKLPAKSFAPSATTEQTSFSIKSEKHVENNDMSLEHSSPKYERMNNKEPIGILVETDSYGNTIYKIRGKPIKFKVVKGRPKNGLFHKTWEWHFDKLKEFQNRWGHTNVTRSVEGYEDIGTWVAEQRRKIKKGRITFDQFSKLNDVGFEWDRSYYFFNSQTMKKAKTSSDEEVASLPSNAEEEGNEDSLAPASAVEPVL